MKIRYMGQINDGVLLEITNGGKVNREILTLQNKELIVEEIPENEDLEMEQESEKRKEDEKKYA